MEPFIGQIQFFGFGFAPRGWTLCQGQLNSIDQNTALFSLLGTIYGGDGRNTFGLPDLRGRSIVHFGQGPGLSYINLGETGWQENTILTVANMPSHNHTGNVKLGTGLANTSSGAGKNFAANTGGSSIYNGGAASDNMDSNVIMANTGGSQSFNIRDPFLGIYIGIALFGIFPSRS